jgi:hypothetical protein
MPDLTEDEYDRCEYCGAILRDPPDCCLKTMNARAEEDVSLFGPEDDEWDALYRDEGQGG